VWITVSPLHWRYLFNFIFALALVMLDLIIVMLDLITLLQALE